MFYIFKRKIYKYLSYVYNMVYNKDKHILLGLQNVTKEDLKTYAGKDKRSVNNFINVAIDKYIEEIKKHNK